MFQTETSVHEKTVQAVARGEFVAHRQRRTPTNQATPTRNLRVNNQVWEAARLLAGGKMSHVVVISENEVIVLNTKEK